MHFIGGQEEDKWDLMFAKVLWINKTHLSSEESFNLVEPTISTKTQYHQMFLNYSPKPKTSRKWEV